MTPRTRYVSPHSLLPPSPDVYVEIVALGAIHLIRDDLGGRRVDHVFFVREREAVNNLKKPNYLINVWRLIVLASCYHSHIKMPFVRVS